MSDINKVYTPEVIAETPFPQTQEEAQASSQSTGGGVYTPETIKDNPVPVKRTAVELLSTALNTVSKKILQTFELVQSGGLQIGKFVAGVSGDVRITPNGITARDSAGNTTFNLDGTNGDAQFAGTLRAGATIVSNSIITQQSANGNGRTVYINGGMPSIVIGDPS